jgi:hypothetical protein
VTEKNQTTDPSRWEILARERNARVVLCHTPDTYTLTELTRSADRAIRVLRDRTFTTLPIEAVSPLFQEYNDTIIRFHEVIEKICGLVEINYKAPRTIAKMLQSKQNNSTEDASTVSDGETLQNKKKSSMLS